MLASQPAQAAPVAIPPQSFTNKLVISIVLLFVFVIPGIIATSIFSREANRAQKAAGHRLPGAQGLIRLNLIIIVLVFMLFVFVGAIFILMVVSASM